MSSTAAWTVVAPAWPPASARAMWPFTQCSDAVIPSTVSGKSLWLSRPFARVKVTSWSHGRGAPGW